MLIRNYALSDGAIKALKDPYAAEFLTKIEPAP